MMVWLVRRLLASIAIVFAVVTIVFILIHLAPGEPFIGQGEFIQDPGIVARLRAEFDLDKPLSVQYWRFLFQAAHGNLGYSFALNRPVHEALADTIPLTLQLTGAALL